MTIENPQIIYKDIFYSWLKGDWVFRVLAVSDATPFIFVELQNIQTNENIKINFDRETLSFPIQNFGLPQLTLKEKQKIVNEGLKIFDRGGRELKGAKMKEFKAYIKVFSDGIGYYLEGQIHREDGPAVIRIDGTKKWYKNGQLHRDDGPAIIHANGAKAWYQNGLLHREDGPAIVNEEKDLNVINIEGKSYKVGDIIPLNV